MAQFVRVPPQRLQQEVLHALLEEFATRDGTDYGEQEVPLQIKLGNLERQIQSGELYLLYESDSEQWDLVPRDQAEELLHS